MNAVGMKTEERTSAIPISAPPTSSMASIAASRWRPHLVRSSPRSLRPRRSRRRPRSPTASTSPEVQASVFTENPTAGKNINAPTSETGIVSSGISVARQLCRKINTSIVTSAIASSSVFTISFAPSVTGTVVSSVRSTSCLAGTAWRARPSSPWRDLRPPARWSRDSGKARGLKKAGRSYMPARCSSRYPARYARRP